MKRREKIGLQMPLMEVITIMSEGNPGALNVLCTLAKEDNGVILILDLDDMGMRGSQIWIEWKDGCGQDLEKFKEFCRSRDETVVSVVNRESSPDYPQAAPHGKS